MSSGNKNVITKNYIHRTLVVWTNVINNFRLLGINVIERNCSDCKYVEIFTHHVGSTGAPSRRTVFIRGTNTKQWEVSKIADRNTKANIFQKGSTAFEATIDLNKKSASRWCLRLRKDCRLNFSKTIIIIIINSINNITPWLTNSDSCSSDQKVSRLSLNPKVHYRVHMNSATGLYPWVCRI
jgi:hypothetical protein